MGSVTNRAIQNEHAREYIKEIWADQLRSEGFVCPDDKLLCWYRVVNHEIIHYISFYTQWSGFPFFLHVSIAACPLFFLPGTLSKVYTNDGPRTHELNKGLTLQNNSSSMTLFSDDNYVYAPQEEGRGISKLHSEILPWLNKIQTVEQCYQTYKADHSRGHETRHFDFSFPLSFIEMAIYFQDVEMWDACRPKAERITRICIDDCAQYPRNEEKKKNMMRWKIALDVLNGGDQQQFLISMEKRRDKSIKWLRNKGIPV